MIGAPRWKQMIGYPAYEISEEGQVRRAGHEMPLKRFRLTQDNLRHREDSNIGTSLCVALYANNCEYVRRIWKLMRRNWPNVVIPEKWKP